MELPTYDIPESTNTMIKLYWTPLIQGPLTGGIALNGYRVLYKADADIEWTTIDSSTIGFTYITPLVPGTFYTFKVIALNKYGVGMDSPTVRIVAGQRPDPAATAPVVTIVDTYIKIAWDSPISNNVPIDAYKVMIRTKDLQFTQQLVNCNASETMIVSSRECFVPMVSLRIEPFNLQYTDPVVVKIIAHNQRGWSEPYNLNDEVTGAP